MQGRVRKTMWSGLALALVVLGALFLLSPTESDALSSNEVEIYYWPSSMDPADADFGNYVGYRFLGCSGERFREGQTTTSRRITLAQPCSTTSLGNAMCYLDGATVSCSYYAKMISIICNSSVFDCSGSGGGEGGEGGEGG